MSQKSDVFNTEFFFLHFIVEKMPISIKYTYKPHQRHNFFVNYTFMTYG